MRSNSAKDEELLFTGESSRYLDTIVDAVWENLFAAVIDKAERERRSFITKEDVRACVHDALIRVIEKEEVPVPAKG